MSERAYGRRRLHAVRQLLVTPLGEIADLVVAQVCLLAARQTVRHRPRGELLHRVRTLPLPYRAPDEQRLTDLAVAVDRVARHGFFVPTCLVRAVALERLIRWADAGSAIVKVGVARQAEGFLAHAWVELEGRVVGDEPSFVRRFTPLDEFSALAS